MLFRFYYWSAFLLLLAQNAATASYLVSGPHIADVNILLPPKMTHPVEYRLQGSGGCFKWSWDHHDILSVLPEYNISNHCSTSARLKSIAPFSGRKETAVYATDIHTGVVIRCKVYIDNFSRIQIFHNSIKLDLDGLATLHVRAFDSQENVFSSLVGLKFRWRLRPEDDRSDHHLVHVPLKDSPLSDCGGLCGDLDIQIRLEESGIFSDLFVVKGAEIGRENVSVHLLEPAHEHIKDTIVLTVAEAMSLDPPSPVFVLVGGVIQYTLKVIRGSIPQVVTLPSPHHHWSVLDSSIAEVDTRIGKAYALSLGVTAISVEDTRVAGHVQMSSLHVVLPDYLSLYILPLSLSGDLVEGVTPTSSLPRWYVVSGRQYLVHMKVFSRGTGAQEVYLTENDDIKWHDNQSEYWNTFPLSDVTTMQRGWWNSRILKATSSGLGKLMASLTYSGGHHASKEVLKVVQEVMVCDKVKLTMNRGSVSENILLPWVPSVYQEVELKATGGCAIASSDYKWFSSDMSSVSVSAFGLVQARRPGKASIRVMSIFDSLNYDEVTVEVSIPSSMAMLPNFPVETVVDSHLPAAVTLIASNGAYFYRCDAFLSSVRWETGSESFNIVNSMKNSFHMDEQEVYGSYSSLHGPPCAWTHVYASSSGRATLHATLTKEYQSFDSNSGPIILKASSLIAAYLPLIVHQAGDGNQYGGYWFDLAQSKANNQLENLADLNLVPGACMDVQLYGGPEPWNEGVEFIETVETVDELHTHVKDGVLVHQTAMARGRLYRIFCHKLGGFKILFRRGNLVGEEHPLPAIAEVEMMLTCSFPSSIILIADEAVNAPDSIRTAIQAVRSSGRIRSAPVTVSNGRTIRVSAIGISDSGKAFGNSSSLFLRWDISNCDGLAFWDDASGLTISKSSWEKFLVLQNSSGLCLVRATVVGLVDTVYGTDKFDSSGSALTDALTLQIVSTLRINPEFNLLFFNPDARLNLSITGGSCFLDAIVNDTRIVEVIQPPTGLQCSQLVLAPKALGFSLVTVNDIGLAPPVAASSVVQVADVDWIKITSGEEISLMKGSSESIDLLAGVHDGSVFDSSQYIYMKICVHIEDYIVEILDSNDQYLKAPNFVIQGRHLGFTTLYLSAKQQSGLEILSQPIKIEVYAPPTIHPNYIFLVPGASYVLTVNGGPTIGAHIEYASMDGKTAAIEKYSGRLSAIAPGNTTLVARIYRNRDTVVGQAYGKVEVAVPSSVILDVQSTQLAVGREMPIFPSLHGGSLFSLYGLCKDYEWTIEDEDILSFQEAEHVKVGRHDDIGFIRVLFGKSAGRAEVSVSFSCDFVSSGLYSQSRLYNASISLGVVPDLPLAGGVPMTWILPPHYTSSSLLPLSSSAGKGSIHYTLMKECSRKNEDAQNDAISIDGSKIKTMESNNLACIQAKDRLTGRTDVASCVRVADVAQIRVTTKVSTFRSVDLAVGAELYLPVTYCDDLGNPFYEAYNILFDVETNYRDIVLLKNAREIEGKIHLKAMRHGKALVQVSFGCNPRKSDYILISVGAHLYPENPVLHLGGHVNFSIEGLNDQAFGRWSSANTSVLSIDRPSGKAEAIGEGMTLILFEGASLKLQTEVTVLKGGNIVSVDAPKQMLTNAPFPAKGYGFSVRVRDADSVYDCSVDPSFVGYAKPWRDLDTSNSYCLFFPYSPEHLVRSIPKSKDMGQDISVTVNASLRGASHISGSASGLFIGGFSVLEMGHSPLQLNLTPDSNKGVFTVVGNTDVEIHWEDRDAILIMPIYREGNGIGGKAQYEVRVLRTERFQKKVIITLPANGQRVEIEVNFEPGEKRRLEKPINAKFWAGVVGSFALLIVAVAAFICFLDRPERSQPTSSHAASPSVAAPVTPERRNLAAVNEHSPKTPKPFIDYVRRTIDETPYYRQEGRRRFNPQNTY